MLFSSCPRRVSRRFLFFLRLASRRVLCVCVCYLSLCVSRGMYYRYRSMPPAGSITLTFTQTEDSLSGRLCVGKREQQH